jgi:hypothetical protein
VIGSRWGPLDPVAGGESLANNRPSDRRCTITWSAIASAYSSQRPRQGSDRAQGQRPRRQVDRRPAPETGAAPRRVLPMRRRDRAQASDQLP